VVEIIESDLLVGGISLLWVSWASVKASARKLSGLV
jgi:hypothetical protein